MSFPVSRRWREAVLSGPMGDPLRSLKHRFDSPVAKRTRAEDLRIPGILASLLPVDGCVVDVGANRGDIIGEAVRIAPRGTHIAIEPLPELAEALRGRFPDVNVHECVVGLQPGSVTFFKDVAAPTRSSLADPSNSSTHHALEVEMETIDRLVAQHDVRPQVVKIDVEGAELDALRGMTETLSRFRPVVLFECDAAWTERFGHTPGAVHDLLVEQHGYRIFDMDGAGPLPRATFDSRAGTTHSEARWNFIARPQA